MFREKAANACLRRLRAVATSVVAAWRWELAQLSHSTILAIALCVIGMALPLGLLGCRERNTPSLDSVQIVRPLPVAPEPPPRLGKPVERFSIDLDGDGRADSLIITAAADSDDPGIYAQLEVVLARGGRHAILERWDPPDEWFHGIGNLVPSRAVFVGHFAGAGTLIFRAGPAYGCCNQSLQIYRVTAAGLEKYYEEEEWGFSEPLRSSPNTVGRMAGFRGLSEIAGSGYVGAVRSATYKPYVVVMLDETARVDTAASARLTRQYEGGFAGLGFPKDVWVVTLRDSSRLVWDAAQKRVLP